MSYKERVRPPSKRHKIYLVMNVTDRAFRRNLHSMVHTYLRLRGEKIGGKKKEFYPIIYRSSKRKLKRTA